MFLKCGIHGNMWMTVFSCLPIQDDKVCVVSVIGKSRYDQHLSKATIINSVIDSNAFLVNILCSCCYKNFY